MPNQADLAYHDPRPEPPRQPAPEECCKGGCEPCVFDRYFEALERYREALQSWLARHSGDGAGGPMPENRD